MEVPRYWRLKKQRYALVGQICPTCASYLFPPRAVCPVCADRTEHSAVRQEIQPALTVEDHAHQVIR